MEEGERGQGGAVTAAGNLLTGGEENAIVFAAQDRGWPGSGTAFPWEQGWAGRSGGAAEAVLDPQGPKSLADWGAKSP